MKNRIERPTANFFFDMEFFEDGEIIDPISIAIVREDGASLYLENAEFNWSSVPSGHWLWTNVKPFLINDPSVRFTKQAIRDKIMEFIEPDRVNPLFWAYYASYDWVCLCQFFGTMKSLPKGFPMFALDLKQSMHERMLGRGAVNGMMDGYKNKDEHNALGDAKWNRQLWARIFNRVDCMEFNHPEPFIDQDCKECDKKRISNAPDPKLLHPVTPETTIENDGIANEPTKV